MSRWLVLLVMTASVTMPPASGFPHQVAMSAAGFWSDGALVVGLVSKGDVDGSLLVFHRDSGSQPIIDRLLPVHLESGRAAKVTLHGLRGDFGVTIRYLDEGSVASSDDLSILKMPYLCETFLPGGAAPPVRVNARVVTPISQTDPRSPRVLVAEDSTVYVGWSTDDSIFLRRSFDRGYTFSNVTAVSGSADAPWDMTERYDGSISLVYRSNVSSAPSWNFLTVDRDGTASTSATLPDLDEGNETKLLSINALRSGTALAMTLKESPNFTRLNIWNVGPDGKSLLKNLAAPGVFREAIVATDENILGLAAVTTEAIHLGRVSWGRGTMNATDTWQQVPNRGGDPASISLVGIHIQADESIRADFVKRSSDPRWIVERARLLPDARLVARTLDITVPDPNVATIGIVGKEAAIREALLNLRAPSGDRTRHSVPEIGLHILSDYVERLLLEDGLTTFASEPAFMTRFPDGHPILAMRSLEAGSSRIIVVPVFDPAANETTGLSSIDGKAPLHRKPTSHQQELRQPHLLEVHVWPSNLAVVAGESATMIASVVNSGQVPVAISPLRIEGLPAGVSFVGSPQQVRLSPGESLSFDLILHVPAASPSGIHTARVSVGSAEGPQGNASVSVRVLPEPILAARMLAPEPQLAAAFAVVGAGAFLLALIVRLGPRRGAFAIGLALYTRLAKGDVLRNETRAAIYAYLQANPRARRNEIKHSLRLTDGVLTFHLRVLEREGYICVTREWTRPRYHAKGGGPMPEEGPVEDSIIRMVMNAHEIEAGALARTMGISRQLARYHLQALVKAQKLVVEDGKYSLRCGGPT